MNIKISTKGSENKVKDIPQKVIQKDIRHGDGQHQTMKTLEKQHRKFHSQLTVSSSRKKKKKEKNREEINKEKHKNISED